MKNLLSDNPDKMKEIEDKIKRKQVGEDITEDDISEESFGTARLSIEDTSD